MVGFEPGSLQLAFLSPRNNTVYEKEGPLGDTQIDEHTCMHILPPLPSQPHLFENLKDRLHSLRQRNLEIETPLMKATWDSVV